MKRIIAFVACAILLVCALNIFVFAEAELPEAPEQVEVVTPETTTEPEVQVEDEPSITETIVDYVKGHFEEISVVITLLLTIFYNVRKHGLLNKSIGTLNNNAISVAENSNISVQNALAEVNRVSATVVGYGETIEKFLTEFRANAEEKEKLAEMLDKAETFIKTAKLANKELADEVASLLTLANIPNSVKDELYARHVNAVHTLAEAEQTEVIHNDGEEA